MDGRVEPGHDGERVRRSNTKTVGIIPEAVIFDRWPFLVIAVLDTAGPPRPFTPIFLTHRLLKQGVDHPVKPGDDGVGESLAKAPGITAALFQKQRRGAPLH